MKRKAGHNTFRSDSITGSTIVKVTTHCKPGVCRCLRCSRRFVSPDVKRIRICLRCKTHHAKEEV
jgi:hypothetical protein